MSKLGSFQIPSLLICAAAIAGCTESPMITGGIVLDQSSSALTQGTVCAVEGTYSGCTQHNDGDNWTVPVGSYTLVAGESALGVVTGDAACTLFVDKVKAGSSCANAATLSTYTSAAHALTTSYAGAGLPFLLNGAGAQQFYANFKASSLSFAADFIIEMLYSDNSSTAVSSSTATWAVAAATVSASGVPAPDDTLSLSGLALTVNGSLVVQSVTGSFSLTNGAVVPTSYVVDPTLGDDLVSGSATFAQIDTVFTSNTAVALGGSPQAIPASAVAPSGSKDLVVGTTVLPQTLDLIVANIENGVTSYKVFEITFDGP